jgi:hypothetical protein
VLAGGGLRADDRHGGGADAHECRSCTGARPTRRPRARCAVTSVAAWPGWSSPSLTALAGALARATVYLGNDSGVSHLAAALGIPSVILFAAPTCRGAVGGARLVRTVTMSRVVDAEVEAVVADVRGC